MKRDAILIPGEYISIPRSVLADQGLTLADKVVLAILIEHLGAENEMSWHGPASMAGEAGISISAVKRSLRNLVTAGRIAKCGVSDVGTQSYGILPPPYPRFNLNRVQKEPGPKRTAPPVQFEPTPPVQNEPQSTEDKSTEDKEPKEGPAAPASPLPARVLQNLEGEGSTSPTPLHHAGSTPAAPAVLEQVPPKTSHASGKPKTAKSTKASKATAELPVFTSPRDVAMYYLFGPQAIGATGEVTAGLLPANTNWAPASKDYAKPEPGVGPQAFAAYAAYRLWVARHQAKLPLHKPDLSRLIGAVKNLQKVMSPENVVAHIDRVSANWSQIRSAIGGQMGASMVPDEGSLEHRSVRAQSDRLAAGQDITARPVSAGRNVSSTMGGNGEYDKW